MTTSHRSDPVGPSMPRPPRGFLDDRSREEIIFMAAVEFMSGLLGCNGFAIISDRDIGFAFNLAEKMYDEAEKRYKAANSDERSGD